MKSHIKHLTKVSLAVFLSLSLLASCMTAGVITAAAAAPGDSATGSGAGYILMGETDTPMSWSDAGVYVTQHGSSYTATIPKSRFARPGANYFIGLSSSPYYQNMFFQNTPVMVTVEDPLNWFSGCGSQTRDYFSFSRISFGTVPASDIILDVNAEQRAYRFSYAAPTDPGFSVSVTAGTGGSVIAGSALIAPGTTETIYTGAADSIPLTATPQSAYKFAGWTATGGVTVIDPNEASTSMTVAYNGAVTANFEPLSTDTQRIYFDNSVANWTQPYAYAFDTAETVYTAAWPGTRMTQYQGSVWYADVSTDATKIIFNQGNATNQTADLTIPTSYARPTYYRHLGSNPSWGEYTETTSSNIKSAMLDPATTHGMYTNINATFYDYYTSSEYNGNYYSSINANTEGWIYGIADRYPYRQFNQSLSEYAQRNNVDYPMYYLAAYYDNQYHSQGYYNESFIINDSNGLGSINKAVTGLSGRTLSGDTIHHFKSGTANENGVPMAMFDEEWLTSRSGYTYNGELATIINSQFPVRKTITQAGYTKVYCDTSEYWGGQQMKAHLWNTGADAVDVSMTQETTNFWSVDCTGYAYVIFYYGNISGSTKTRDMPIPSDTNRTVKIGNDVWIQTSSYYTNRDHTNGGQAYYEFDSTNGKDTVYFDDCTSACPTLYYEANNANGHAKRNGYNFNYSFLPFDNNATGRPGYGKDFGFGMKLEINFTLGRDYSGTPETNPNYGKENGLVDGMAQKFDFSGDDDLWVFVDDQLILDLGGAHAATNGIINFHTNSVTVDPAAYTSLNPVSRNTPFTLADRDVHKMTIYYTERGMHESNLKFGFSFAPVDSDFGVGKAISPASVNAGLRDAVMTVAQNDRFTVNHYYGNTKAEAEANTANIGAVPFTHTAQNGVQTQRTTNDGAYSLRDDEFARFTNVLHKETYLDKYFMLTESTDGTVFGYTPSFTVRDRENGQTLSSLEPVSNGGVFKFNNYDESAMVGDMTPVHLDAVFTNRINTHNLIIKKHVVGSSVDTGDLFTVKVEVDIDGDRTDHDFETYALTYDVSATGTMNAAVGTITLRNDETVVIPGIPEKANVKVTEIGINDRYAFDSVELTGVDPGVSVPDGVQFAMTNDAELCINNVFAPHTITVTTDGHGTAAANVPEAIAGTVVSLTATPNAGYGFREWQVPDNTVTIENNQFIMPACDVEIKAVFIPVTYKITVDSSVEVYRRVSGEAETAANAAAGEALYVKLADGATPDPGCYFTGEFTVNGTSLGTESESGTTWYRDDFSMPGQEVTVSAVQAQQETLAVNLSKAAPVEITQNAFLQMNREIPAAYDSQMEATLLDIDNSGTPDVKLTVTFDTDETDITAVHYFAQKLANADAYGAYPFNFTINTDRYSSITLSTAQIGDVNLDGWVNVRDVTALQRHLAQISQLPDEMLLIADTNANGLIDIDDVTRLQMYLAEYDVVLGSPA